MKKTLASTLASLLVARANCANGANPEWFERHTDRIVSLCDEHLPSGSGLDLGPKFDFTRSTPERLVFSHCDFHHMDEHGGYDGWTEHSVVVTPSLAFGFEVRVTGRDRNEIKTYLGDLFHEALSREVE